MRAIPAWILSLSIFFFLLPLPGFAQEHRSQSPRIDGTPVTTAEPDQGRDRIAQDMAKKANLERHAALKRDTDKLVTLAEELKNYVNKSNENVLSLDVLKKAEEIEKLARSVKDKMKGPN